MKKIINPWNDKEGHNCFGCSKHNDSGVKMDFYEDGDEVVSVWKPQPQFQGWVNTLHGGIQAVLLTRSVHGLFFVNFKLPALPQKWKPGI